MDTTKQRQGRSTRRGRPRTTEPPAGLVRRNLLVDPDALGQLRALFGTKSESEAVRRAIDLVLLAHEGEMLGEWLASRGGPVDAYGPPPPLPVYLRPEDHAAEEGDGDRAG